jgi:stage V sporulation protein G
MGLRIHRTGQSSIAGFTTGGIVEITEIRLTIRNEERLKAFANITFDDAFVIRGLKVINGNKGLFVSMPSRRRSDGSYQDVAHPINTQMRRHLEQMVIEAYEDEIKLSEPEANESYG